MSLCCPTCGSSSSDGGVCSNGWHIGKGFAELEEAKELLECLENGMSVEGVLNGEPVKGTLVTPEFMDRVKRFLSGTSTKGST